MDPTDNAINQYNPLINEEKDLTPELPSEIKQMILSNFKNRDLHQVSGVSMAWNSATRVNPKSVVRSIQHFATVLAGCLPESYADQKARLIDIESDNKIFDSLNVMEIKQHAHKLKENIADILKDLKKVDLINLEKLFEMETKPASFENLFELAKIYKKLKKVNSRLLQVQTDVFMAIKRPRKFLSELHVDKDRTLQ